MIASATLVPSRPGLPRRRLMHAGGVGRRCRGGTAELRRSVRGLLIAGRPWGTPLQVFAVRGRQATKPGPGECVHPLRRRRLGRRRCHSRPSVARCRARFPSPTQDRTRRAAGHGPGVARVTVRPWVAKRRPACRRPGLFAEAAGCHEQVPEPRGSPAPTARDAAVLAAAGIASAQAYQAGSVRLGGGAAPTAPERRAPGTRFGWPSWTQTGSRPFPPWGPTLAPAPACAACGRRGAARGAARVHHGAALKVGEAPAGD